MATKALSAFIRASAWKGEALTLAMLRIVTGLFLIHGVLDNILAPQRMQEFAAFMGAAGFAAPQFWAPFSVYTQLLAGILLVTGLGVRFAGAIICITFLVALYMVHWSQSFREWWPALALVMIGLHLIARGAGRLSLDAMLERRVGRGRP
jgi:putative oxidoreductase